MSTDTTYVMGYGSWALARFRVGDSEPNIGDDELEEEDCMILPMVSADYSRSQNVATMTPFDVDVLTGQSYSRSTFRIGSGTYSYSGNLNLEMSKGLTDLIFTSDFLFSRRNFIDLRLCDGEKVMNIDGAVWSSLSLNVQANQLISCSLGFSTCNSFKQDIKDIITDYDGIIPENFDGDETLVELEPYWQFGNPHVESFSLSVNRNVTPVYLNESSWKGPSYLRVGLLEVSMSITCWDVWFDSMEIALGYSKKMTFNSSAFLSQRQYSFAGIEGNGVKTYSLNALGTQGASSLFSISSR